ncbi:MAG TPA: TolC family protein [Gemmatimonadaceae bacterium]|nr:TolC family protein [Gemmatimonadaceae bacterium]
MRKARAAQTAVLVLLGGSAACIHNPPSVGGKPSAPTAPNQYWTPPKHAIVRDSVPKNVVPSDIQQRINQLTLQDVVDLGLLNNPQTRASYAQARAAGALIGSTRGKYLPQVTANALAERTGSTGGTGTVAGGTTVGGTSGSSATAERDRAIFQPSVTANWLLFDFGRFGAIEAAKQGAFAASYTHNATVQAVTLAIIQSYCNYNAAKAVRDGAAKTVQEDSVGLASAKDRHDAGVATISDVLQAQVTYSQAVLSLETDEGSVQTTRGSLAVALGFPANLPYDIAPEPPNVPVQAIAQSVDSLVDEAVNHRPDLASFRATAKEQHANIGVARGAWLPQVTLGGTGSQTFYSQDQRNLNGHTWSLQAGVSIPIFSGLQNYYDILQAKELARAADANAEYQRDLVVYQVFTSYYNLRTATAQVKSSRDLLASAQTNYDVALGKYKQGVGSILDLLTAEAALASARATEAQTRWTWYADLAQLSHDAGVIGIHGEMPIGLTSDSTSRGSR